LHGALLDARILADVYLAMTGGQSALQLGETSHKTARSGETSRRWVRREGATLKVIQPNAAELAAHEAMLAKIAKNSSSGERR